MLKRGGGRILLTVPYHGRVQAAAIALTRFEAHFDPLGQHVRFFTRRSLATVARARGVRGRPRAPGPAAEVANRRRAPPLAARRRRCRSCSAATGGRGSRRSGRSAARPSDRRPRRAGSARAGARSPGWRARGRSPGRAPAWPARCGRRPARSPTGRTAGRPRAGCGRGRSGRSRRRPRIWPLASRSSAAVCAWSERTGCTRAPGGDQGDQRRRRQRRRRASRAAARGSAPPVPEIRSRSVARDATQPAHSRAGSTLPGTNQVQSIAECRPKTIATVGERGEPDPLGVPGRSRGRAAGCRPRGPALVSHAPAASRESASPTQPRSDSVCTT